jgi:hypothetical protein
VSLGFAWSASGHAIYTRGEGDSRLLLSIYIDDLAITRACTTAISRFKQKMCDRFKMSNLGLLTLYPGIKVCERIRGKSALEGWHR